MQLFSFSMEKLVWQSLRQCQGRKQCLFSDFQSKIEGPCPHNRFFLMYVKQETAVCIRKLAQQTRAFNRLEDTVVQAFYNMTLNKLQQKLFLLF